jgi:hypothetical protein
VAMAKERPRQQPIWIETGELPQTRGHAFYNSLKCSSRSVTSSLIPISKSRLLPRVASR